VPAAYPPELLDRLQALTPAPWSGQVFRHMFGSYPPDAENTRGARWNPPGVAAIYTSLTREGALAEAESPDSRPADPAPRSAHHLHGRACPD
jgi:RES domain-containing protein